jgi:hypothetical protein
MARCNHELAEGRTGNLWRGLPLQQMAVDLRSPGDDGMATRAQGEIVTSKGRTLTYLATEVPVHVGDEVRSASGEKVLVTGGRAPPK